MKEGAVYYVTWSVGLLTAAAVIGAIISVAHLLNEINELGERTTVHIDEWKVRRVETALTMRVFFR